MFRDSTTRFETLSLTVAALTKAKALADHTEKKRLMEAQIAEWTKSAAESKARAEEGAAAAKARAEEAAAEAKAKAEEAAAAIEKISSESQAKIRKVEELLHELKARDQDYVFVSEIVNSW